MVDADERLDALGLDVSARRSNVPSPPKRNPSPLGTGTILAQPIKRPAPAAIIRKR
jgi:hypothetical protein